MRTVQRDIAGIFIFSADDKILLCKSYKGGAYEDFWIIPGGGIEPNETKLQAAQRETLEEVGIDITPYKVVMIDDVMSDRRQKTLRETGETVKVNMTFYSFTVHADMPAKDIVVTCGDDIIEAMWYPFVELPNLNIPPTTQKILTNLGIM